MHNNDNNYTTIPVGRNVVTKDNELVFLKSVMGSIAYGITRSGESYIKDITTISIRDRQEIFGEINVGTL